MSLALLGAGQVARAGYWKVDHVDVSGKVIRPEQSDFAPTDPAYNATQTHGERPLSSGANGTDEGFVFTYGDGSYSTKRGITLKRSILGSGTVEFSWVAEYSDGTPDESTPPDYLYVKIIAEANGSASTTVDSGGNATLAADSVKLTISNGYEATEITENPANNSERRNISGQITTTRLKRFASYGRSVVPVPLPSLNVVAEARNDEFSYTHPRGGTAYYPVEAAVGSGGKVTAKLDSRGIIITCPTIEESLKKGTRPADRPELTLFQQPNVREKDGSIVTDSAAQWYETLDGSFKGWLGGGSFSAPSIGISNPTYTWDVKDGQYHNSDDGMTPSQFTVSPALPTSSTP